MPGRRARRQIERDMVRNGGLLNRFLLFGVTGVKAPCAPNLVGETTDVRLAVQVPRDDEVGLVFADFVMQVVVALVAANEGSCGRFVVQGNPWNLVIFPHAGAIFP